MSAGFLCEDLARAWAGKDPLQAAAAQPGDLLKCKDGRRTLRFRAGERSYVLKYHPGVGWREIFKCLLQLRVPVLDAGHELRAAHALAAAGVPSLSVAGFASRGWNPATRRSFIVTEDLGARPSLERHCAHWQAAVPPARQRRLLLQRVAEIARDMHAAGVNHRDFYLCHLLLDEVSLATARHSPDIGLWVIDLHRAQVRTRVLRGARAKDLAALAWSARALRLTHRERLHFLRVYADTGLREAMAQQASLLREVERRLRRLAAREARRAC